MSEMTVVGADQFPASLTSDDLVLDDGSLDTGVALPVPLDLRKRVPGFAAARGAVGENTVAFIYGAMGWEVVFGPSGAGGKGATVRGVDFVAWHPQLQRLVIGDNKSYESTADISSVSALTTNLRTNVAALLTSVTQAADFSGKPEVIRRLQALLEVLDAGGGTVPDGVEFVVTTAGGNSEGLAESVQRAFAANGLKAGTGDPVRIQFQPLQDAADVAQARDAQEAAHAAARRGGPPLADPSVLDTEAALEPLIPTTGEPLDAIAGPAARAEAIGNGAILALDLLKSLSVLLLGLAMPTRAEADTRARAGDIARMIAEQPPDGGVMLVYWWSGRNFPTAIEGIVDPLSDAARGWIYERLELHAAPTAEQAYAAYCVGSVTNQDRVWIARLLWVTRAGARPYTPPAVPPPPSESD